MLLPTQRLRITCTLLLLPVVASGAERSHECDRACLRARLDGYLAAVIKHDPAAAPLAYGYRHTENAINIPLGKGVWQSVTALGKVQRRFFDPVSSQAAYYGLVEESGKVAVVTVRLRIESRAVTEAEWYIARAGDPGLPGANPPNSWSPDGLIATPPPERTLPGSRRLPRQAMIAIVNSYFDGITSHDGSVVLARPGCNRYENGTRVTGRSVPVGDLVTERPVKESPPGAARSVRGPMAQAVPAGDSRVTERPAPSVSRPFGQHGGAGDDCVSGFGNFNLANVAARRVGFVDEEAGMVLGMAVFIRRPGSPVPRNVFSEWFAIEDGRIRDIWTAMFYPGAERPVPNWPPFDGSFPLPGPPGASNP